MRIGEVDFDEVSKMMIAYRRAINVLAIAVVFAVWSQPARAATARCDIAAFSVDKDPKGLNVRAGPGRKFKVVGRVAKTRTGALVNVTGAKNGWVRLSKAEDPDHAPAKILFKGVGWVYGRLIGTQTRGYSTGVILRATPGARAKAIVKVPGEEFVRLADCKGRWAKVIWRGKSGWLAPKDQCGLSFTTCP